MGGMVFRSAVLTRMALIEGCSRSKWPALGREVGKGGGLVGWVLSVEAAVL